MNILLFLVIIFSFYTQEFRQVFWLSFLGGLFLDLIFGNLIGFSSLCFLMICFLVYVYRKRFSSSHFLFQLSFILLADWLFTWLNREIWTLKSVLILSLLSLIIFSFVNRMKRKSVLELEIN